MIDVNTFPGFTDSDVLDHAFSQIGPDGVVIIPPRCRENEPERTYWLIDRAILIPENTTVILQNCRIKLSDRCRDNFFRTANCGFGFPDPKRISNVHIRGEGRCVLEGADHPRSTGDGKKKLVCPTPEKKFGFSYGTDCGRPDESQYGDWRNVGILFANVEHFSVENLTIINAHSWAISFEACCQGSVRNITFDAHYHREFNGVTHNVENQDGIDLRNGCHHIVISDIFGQTGDDVIALTAHLGYRDLPGGSLCTSHVMHTDYARRDPDIHDVIIRNVLAQSQKYAIVRLLPAGTHLWNISIDGVVDTSLETGRNTTTFIFGTTGTYGTSSTDELRNIMVSNVISSAKKVFDVQGYWSDSVVCNVINKNPEAPVFCCAKEDGMTRVQTLNIHTQE